MWEACGAPRKICQAGGVLWCHTPFKGVCVYARSAMGMPGSETALEEVMCHVVGHLLQDSVVAKIADDLHCGGTTPQELFQNWKKVLEALYKCDLRLSASKTIINPKSTIILGGIWIWWYPHSQFPPCQHPCFMPRTRHSWPYAILCWGIQGSFLCNSTMLSLPCPTR